MRLILRRYVLPLVLIAVAVHAGAVWAVPRLVMWKIMHDVTRAAGANTPYLPPRATALSRDIPLPSPDLLYGLCALDLSRGPVAVSVTPGPDYLSLAVFDAATDNVFVTNDQQAAGQPIRLLITGPGNSTPSIAADTRVVRLGTSSGLLLLRALAATPALLERNEVARHSLRCSAPG
jgi:uncharacterized membrane protein